MPDEQLREVFLEEHLECGCQCDRLAALHCPGQFNESTCECQCDQERFGQVRSLHIIIYIILSYFGKI